MTPTVPGLGEKSGQAGKEERTGPSACLELGLEVAGPVSLPLMGDLSEPGPKWRVELAVGTASGQRTKKKKKVIFSDLLS